MSARGSVLFIDDGGVMNDNRLRGEQWSRLLGAYLPSVLGGLPEAWSAANREVMQRMFEGDAWTIRLAASSSYADFERAYARDWIEGMCTLVGIEAPGGDQGLDILRRAGAYVTRRVRASFPRAADAIHLLHSRGYELNTASGESSLELDAYLTAMDVRACFARLYGPDLVNTMKGGPDYYTRILADANVRPADALVVDDSLVAVEWARQAGALCVLVSANPPLDAHCIARISALSALPAYLESL